MASRTASSLNPIGRGSGPSPAADLLSEQLKAQLGPFGYQWLCACAIYPKLRFALSTYLGQVLAQRLGRPAPNEDEHLALFRLAWFRQGWMPEDLRVRLLRDLDDDVQKELREAIEALLYSVVAHPAASNDGLAAVDKPPLRWRSMLRAYLDNAPRDSAESDSVFISYMKSRPVTPAALAREARFVRLFGRKALALLDWRNGLVFAAALAIAIAWATADSWLKPYFEKSSVVQEVIAAPDPGGSAPSEPDTNTTADENPNTEVPGLDNSTAAAEVVAGYEKARNEREAYERRQRELASAAAASAASDADWVVENAATTDEQGLPFPGPGAGEQSGPPAQGGATRQNVASVQSALRQAGLYSGGNDGYMGPATVAAINAYQKSKGLPVTGQITPELLESLGIRSAPTGE